MSAVGNTQARTRALVLGGGGAVGVAWEVGVLAGLAAAGFDLTGVHAAGSPTPDLILGTSAGSIVGAMLATHHIDRLIDLATNQASSAVIDEVVPLLDFVRMGETFAAWQNISADNPENLRRVCELAAGTSSISEDRWVGSMAENVAPGWPDSRFHCAAVDTATGQRVVWNEASQVDVARAVASSCSVPAVFPSVTISSGGVTSRYTDGGVHSGTSIDIATGHDRILVLAPIGSWAGDSLDAAAARGIALETAQVQATGSEVLSVLTDDATNQATLNTLLGRMDPNSRRPAVEHGIRQGKELADRLHGWW